MPALCQLCNAPVEEPDQPEGAELCNACAKYLSERFGEFTDDLTDAALDTAFQDAMDKED